jgi:chromosome segregation ATPase
LGTKLQLKQRCKELEEMLTAAENRGNSYAELAKERTVEIEYLKVEIEDIRQWGKNLQEQVNFYRGCLAKLRYVMALDIVGELTHRQRNEVWREWQEIVWQWLSTESYKIEKYDDIPF